MENNQDWHDRDTKPISRRRIQEELDAKQAAAEDEAPTPEPAEPAPPEMITEQDRIPTPMPVQPLVAQSEPEKARPSRGLRVMVALALLLSLVSLVLNGVLIYGLLNARQAAIDELDRAIAALDNLAGQGIHFEYRLQQTVPFSGDIPFNQELVFPFEGDIPIKTTVQVPVDAGILGKFVIDVPIDTTFHVDLEVPVKIDQTVHVDTEIPLDMTIPIDISPDDPAIQKLLDQVRQTLVRLRDSF